MEFFSLLSEVWIVPVAAYNAVYRFVDDPRTNVLSIEGMTDVGVNVMLLKGVPEVGVRTRLLVPAIPLLKNTGWMQLTVPANVLALLAVRLPPMLMAPPNVVKP